MRIETLGDLVNALDEVKKHKTAVFTTMIKNENCGGTKMDEVRAAEAKLNKLLETKLDKLLETKLDLSGG